MPQKTNYRQEGKKGREFSLGVLFDLPRKRENIDSYYSDGNVIDNSPEKLNKENLLNRTWGGLKILATIRANDKPSSLPPTQKGVREPRNRSSCSVPDQTKSGSCIGAFGAQT